MTWLISTENGFDVKERGDLMVSVEKLNLTRCTWLFYISLTIVGALGNRGYDTISRCLAHPLHSLNSYTPVIDPRRDLTIRQGHCSNNHWKLFFTAHSHHIYSEDAKLLFPFQIILSRDSATDISRLDDHSDKTE